MKLLVAFALLWSIAQLPPKEGVIASTKGRWPSLTAEGATVNATVDDRDADMGGGALYHDNRVRLDRIVSCHRSSG